MIFANLTVLAENGIQSEELPDFGNIFEPYLTEKAPKILKTLSETVADGIKQTEIQFDSYNGKNKIYAKIYTPEEQGVYPGIALFHWGDGSAESQAELASFLAKEGYTVITPDLPGIGNPLKMPFSEGDFKELGYTENAQFNMNSDPKNSTIFQAVIAALDSVYLLKSLECTDSEKIGISGDSWGGFTTIRLSGLLGDKISCAYSLYGTAYYDSGTHWSENVFPHFNETNKKLWMKYLDASVTISDITCPFFIESPTNDSYFYPTASEKTIKNIKSYIGHAFVANANHIPHPWNFTQRLGFFNYYLKNSKIKPLAISDIEAEQETKLGLPVNFSVPSDRSIHARVYFADSDLDFAEKEWTSVTATVENGKATAFIPSDLLFKNTVLFGYAADENRFYASTDMLSIKNLNPRSLNEKEKLSLFKPVLVINDSDKECETTGTWNLSYYSGYEEQSIYTEEPGAYAKYTPFLKDGKYKISAFVVVNESNPELLTAVVNSSGEKLKTVNFSTQIPKSDWVEIGEFEFDTGYNGSVILKSGRAADSFSDPVHLDAVRFEYIGGKERKPSVYLDGKKLELPDDQQPLIVNNRTLVPFRSIFEALGLSVSWKPKTQTVIGSKPGMEIYFYINGNVAQVNGIKKELDVPAQIINDRTYIPLRFLSEALGLTVSWDDKTGMVSITSSTNKPHYPYKF